MNAQTKLSAKGQVVIPKDVRDRLQWQQGQALEVVETSEGVLLKQPSLRPQISHEDALAKIRSIVKYTGPTITIQEMNEAIDEGWQQAALKSDCAKR
jgi:AbrB family looped-hinge helix DNA binding protein